MRLSGLFILVLIFSIFHSAIYSQSIENIITKDEIISSSGDLVKGETDLIWECDFTDVSIWEAQNFLRVNTDAAGNLVVGDEKIHFTDKLRYGNFTGKCIVSTDFDPGTDLPSFIVTKTPVSISGNDRIILSFSQIFRNINSSESFVEISTDNISWEKIEVNSCISNAKEVVNNVFIDISESVNGKNNLWMKFITSSNNMLWIIDNVKLQGIVTLLPEILTVNPNQGQQGESLTVALSGQLTHFQQGSQTVWFEQASQTIISGNNINVFSLTQLDFNVSIPISAPVGLYDVKVFNYTDGTITKPNGFTVLPAPSPNWNYTSTGIDHEILIPSFATITIDGVPVSNGDYLGVFYDSAGTYACGGYIGWYGNTTVLHAWANDPFTIVKDGFDISEEFVWKLWDASTNNEYFAEPSYQVSGFPNTGFFAMNGNSGIVSLIAYSSQTQTITLDLGWEIYSTYIDPVNNSLVDVFAPVISNVLIIKNGMGQVYWPPFVNQIGNIVVGQGYQVNMSAPASLNITGTAVTPELTPINIPLGWSLIGYLRQTPANAVTMLAPVVSSVIIVKDGWGAVYWPAWGINNIGNFEPGEGYQIRTSGAVTLYYPANNQIMKTGDYTSTYSRVFYGEPLNTGNNMTLCIPLSSWEELPLPGDEIGIFNSNDELVGSAVFDGRNLAVAIWGDDDFTTDNIEYLDNNRSFGIRLYQHNSGKETLLEVTEWIEGGSLYKKDLLSVAGKIKIADELKLFQNMPNPCSDYTVISFEIPEAKSVTLDIYNLLGEKVLKIDNSLKPKGKHSFTIDVNSLSEGVYIYKLTAGEIVTAKQFTVIR